jgi:hypothetical protein
MITISLTRFVDFVIKSGSPKYTSLKETKDQVSKAYDPAADYYKQIRDAIVEHHRKGTPYSAVEAVANSATNRSKSTNYPLIALGHKKFLGKKTVAWFKPPSTPWVHGGVTVALNPELGLEIGGKKCVIKMYFKSDQPRKLEVKAILALMDDQLQDATKSRVMAILDVRRSKLITDHPPDQALLALMKGEAAAIQTIWPSL